MLRRAHSVVFKGSNLHPAVIAGFQKQPACRLITHTRLTSTQHFHFNLNNSKFQLWLPSPAQRCIESESSPFPHRLRLLQKWWQIESHDWLLICNRRQLPELDGAGPELAKGSLGFSCGGTWIPELIEAGLSAAAEICHRARERPCIHTSYEIQQRSPA